MVLTGIKKRPKIKLDMKKISSIRRTRRVKKIEKKHTWRQYVGKKPTPKTYYNCPICHKKRASYNKTEIFHKGKYIFGCQDCFMRSIDSPEPAPKKKRPVWVMKTPDYKLKLLHNIKH